MRELVGVAVTGAELGGDVRGPRAGGGSPVTALRTAAMARCALPDAAGVLPEHDITDIMVHLYGPVAAQVRRAGQPALLRPAVRLVTARTATAAEQPPVGRVAVALDEEDLLHVREQGRGSASFGGSVLMVRTSVAAVAAVDGPGLPGYRSVQGRASAAAEQLRLVTRRW